MTLLFISWHLPTKLITIGKLATAKKFKADISSISPSSKQRDDLKKTKKSPRGIGPGHHLHPTAIPRVKKLLAALKI